MKQTLPYFLIFSMLFFFGCEDVFDCIINRSPELPDKQLQDASTTSYYYTELQAQVKNDPNDNDYDYYFDIDINDLPLGLDYYIDYRTIIIEGMPLETGNFRINVYLEVEGPVGIDYDEDGDIIYDDDLCNHSTTKIYRLRVNE